jgi:multidrug efflux pump subunit AcrB
VQAPVEIKILGDNNTVLRELSQDVEAIFNRTAGLVNINNSLGISKTDIHVDIHREAAAMLAVPLVEIDRTVRLGIAGLTVSKYRDTEGKEYHIVLRADFKERPSLDIFDRIYLSSLTGAMVPLHQVAAIKLKVSPSRIKHFNLERSASLTADVLAGHPVREVTGQIISQLEQYTWPAGYHYFVGGEKESQEESFGGMGKAVLIAIIAIFAVLVLQFKSFRQPLVVFAALPLAVIGSVVALLVTGNTFSFTAFIGLTSLVGIVVNNSIIDQVFAHHPDHHDHHRRSAAPDLAGRYPVGADGLDDYRRFADLHHPDPDRGPGALPVSGR